MMAGPEVDLLDRQAALLLPSFHSRLTDIEFFEIPGLRVRMVRLDYLFYMKAWAGDPVDQRDLRVIANALKLNDEHQAHEIVRRYSPGELPREILILIESLFE